MLRSVGDRGSRLSLTSLRSDQSLQSAGSRTAGSRSATPNLSNKQKTPPSAPAKMDMFTATTARATAQRPSPKRPPTRPSMMVCCVCVLCYWRGLF